MNSEETIIELFGKMPYKPLVEEIKDYAIFHLDVAGHILSWNQGAQLIFGYTKDEIIERDFTVLFTPEDRAENIPAQELKKAAETGRAEDTRWHLRKDGSLFFAQGATTALRDKNEKLIGYAKIARDDTARRQMEGALLESEERYRIVAETATDAIISIDEQSTIIFINKAATRIFGYEIEQMLGQPLTMLMPDYLRHAHAAGLKRYLETGKRHLSWEHVEVPGLHKDGHEFPLELSFGEFNKNNKHIFIGIARDITIRKQTEEKLQFLITLNQVLMPLSEPEEIMSVTARMLGEHLRVNRCAYAEVFEDEDTFRITGDYTNDTFSIIDEFKLSAFGDEALRLMRENLPYIINDAENDSRTKQNLESYQQTDIAAVISVPLHKNGRFVAGIAVHQKVPRQWTSEEIELVQIVAHRCWESIERVRTVRNLRGSEERFRAIVSQATAGISQGDQTGRFTFVNDRFCEIVGYSREELLNMRMQDISDPEIIPANLELYKRIWQDGTPFVIEKQYICKDGSRVWVSNSVAPVVGAFGKTESLVCVTIDISNRKRAEEERERLLQSEQQAREEAQRANRLKDEFLATVSHELRTPLNSILGWSQMLQNNNLDEAASKRALATIERNARAQNQLIEDILDVSRIITGKLRLNIQSVDLQSVIMAAVDAVRPGADAKNIRLQTLLDPEVAPISGDPDRLQQIFWNLLSNAIKFTPREGRVQVRLERGNSHIKIVVSDSGSGIEPEFLPFVFERFRQSDASTTRRHGGLGLGLAIVRQLVELHGGTVSVESDGEGKGTTFVVSLPLLPVRLEPLSEIPRFHPIKQIGSPTDCPPELSGLRVLLVDDETDARDLLKTVLESCGAQVWSAGSAAEAFNEIKRERFDVILSDIGMPEEDGYSLIRKIRDLPDEQGGNMPAIALTAYARAEDRVQALRSGFQLHIAKPVESAELIAAVANLAGRIRKQFV
ncbi:MAG: PAS domain S-box protein [Acidobacteriota bacterium]|nr:PAS domain S-box protein [Acidobacteriota bacterium]